MLTNKAQTKAYEISLMTSKKVKTAGQCSYFTLPTRLHVGGFNSGLQAQVTSKRKQRENKLQVTSVIHRVSQDWPH